MLEIDAIRQVLSQNAFIVIAAHINPDGDAIGSSFGLALALKKLGKKTMVLLESYQRKYDVIPGKDCLYTGDISGLCPDVFVALDCGALDRLGHTQTLLDNSKQVVVIDHHIDNSIVCDYQYIQEEASSTSQLVYHVIQDWIDLDVMIASALYAGMVCDTGGFRHGCTSPETMEICARFMRLGIPFTHIYNELMHVHALCEAQIFNRALQHMSIHAQGCLAASMIRYEDFQTIGATPQDLDGIVEYILNLRDVVASVLVYEKKPGIIKISLRSKSIDVCQVAKQFQGGGHRNAAGGHYNGSPDAALEAVLPVLTNAIKIELKSP